MQLIDVYFEHAIITLHPLIKYFQLECQIKFSPKMFNYGCNGRWCTDFPLTNNFFLHAFFVWNFVTDLLPNWLAVFLFYFFAFFTRYPNTFFFRVWDAFLFVLHLAIFLWFGFAFLLYNADCFGILSTNRLVNHLTRFLGDSFALQFLDITALFSRNVFTFFLVNFHTFLSRHAFAFVPFDLNTFLLSFFFIFPIIRVLRLFRFVVYFFGKLVKFFDDFLHRSLYFKIIILVIFKILLEKFSKTNVFIRLFCCADIIPDLCTCFIPLFSADIIPDLCACFIPLLGADIFVNLPM